MLFKIGFDMIKKNKIMSIVIVLQLAVSIMLMNISIAMYNNVTIRIRAIAEFESNSTIFFMARESLSDQEYNSLQKNLNHSVIEPIFSCGFYNSQDDMKIYANAYGNQTSEKLSINMISGKWYEDYPKENGLVNVVAYEGGDFNVGDVYETYLSSPEKLIPIKLRVTGIANKKTGFISDATVSSYLETDSLFENIDYTEMGTNNFFLLNYNDLFDQQITENDLLKMPNMFIFSDQTDNSDYIEILANMGSSCTFQTILNNSSEFLAEKLHTIYPVAIGVLLSGIFGVECLIVLDNLKNRKRFAIFYICGMKWSDCIKISIIQLSYIMMASIILSLVACEIMIQNNVLNFNEITLYSNNNVIISVCVILLMYFISVVSSKLMVSGSAPKDYLKD